MWRRLRVSECTDLEVWPIPIFRAAKWQILIFRAAKHVFFFGSRQCAAVLHKQVPKKCTDLALALLYILTWGTHGKFARKNEFLTLSVSFPQTCSSAGRMIAASRSRVQYYQRIVLIPMNEPCHTWICNVDYAYQSCHSHERGTSRVKTGHATIHELCHAQNHTHTQTQSLKYIQEQTDACAHTFPLIRTHSHFDTNVSWNWTFSLSKLDERTHESRHRII